MAEAGGAVENARMAERMKNVKHVIMVLSVRTRSGFVRERMEREVCVLWLKKFGLCLAPSLLPRKVVPPGGMHGVL